MWKHHRKCPAKPSFVKSDAPVRNSRLFSLVSVECSEAFRKNVIGKMRNDIISFKAKTDPLIVQFGERKYEKRGKHAHTHQYISEKVRSLGRLMCTVSELDNSITKLEQCIASSKWELLLKAVKQVAEYDPLSDTFKKPTLAEKLGHYIKKCASMVITNARKNGDKEAKEIGNDFLETYKEEWTDRIGSKAYESKSEATYNKVQRLPLVEDVKKLTRYIEDQIKSTVESTEDRDTKHNKLAQLCLAQILLFNRKRSGEAQRLRSDDYKKAILSDTPVDDDVRKCLSKFEQGLCKTHSRIETRGKKGRKVAILLNKAMQKNIETLMSLKNDLTEFLFQIPGSVFPIRGADVLRRFSREAGLKHETAITSTSLRKQLATLSQILNLDQNDQDILAKFMGHDLNIHREFYRLPQSTLEIAKVSKVLHALNTGSIESIKNKDLDDIDATGHMDAEQESDEEDVLEDSVNSGDSVDSVDSEDSSDEGGSVDSDDYVPPRRRECKKRTRTPYQKTPWTDEEQKVVIHGLRKCFALDILPKKLECEELIRKNPVLKKRSWTMVKGFVRTRQIAMKKKQSR